MIRYTVLWRKELIDELARLWTEYHDRAAISAAANRIDEELLVDAHSMGSLLHTGRRTLASGPLAVYFRVDEADRKVFVEALLLTEEN